MKKVRIIGAGFSGLTLAYYLAKKNVPVEIIEKSDAPGGLLGTHRESWGLIEQAANGILNSKDVEVLFHELKITPAWPNRQNKARYVFKDGKLTKWPFSISESMALGSKLFQVVASVNKRTPMKNESLESYITRILGRPVFDYLIAPAMRGVYGTEHLSAELLYASITNRNTRKGARRGTVSCAGGMGEISQKIISTLDQWDIKVQYNTIGEIDPRHLNVLAVDAHSASVLLTPYDMNSAQRLQHVEYQPLTSITVGFKKSSRTLKGFGALFPPKENFNSLGALFNTDLFDGRGPDTTETWIFQGADLSEEEYLQKILQDRKRFVDADDIIDSYKVFNYKHGIPIYNTYLGDALNDITVPEYVHLHGNYLGGIGLQKILTRSSILAHEIALDFDGSQI